jgi:hypothetical protein
VSRYFFMSRTALRCRVRELCAYFPYPGMVRGQGWMLATRSRDDGIADTDVDRAMQPQQGNPVVTRAEGLLRVLDPEDRAKRVDRGLPQRHPVPLWTHREGQLQLDRAVTGHTTPLRKLGSDLLLPGRLVRRGGGVDGGERLPRPERGGSLHRRLDADRRDALTLGRPRAVDPLVPEPADDRIQIVVQILSPARQRLPSGNPTSRPPLAGCCHTPPARIQQLLDPVEVPVQRNLDG